MDVGLVNDGPVGVDYRCEDEAVNTEPSVFSNCSSIYLLTLLLGHH